MSPHVKMLRFIMLNIILHFTRQTISKCVTVYVSVDSIDSSLTAEDFEGKYNYDGFETVSDCSSYSSTDGQTLRYFAGSWSLSSAANDIFTYETTAGVPCNPPLGIMMWEHGQTSDAGIVMTCSDTDNPTVEPTFEPTIEPTSNPTTTNPTAHPSEEPTTTPTNMPSTPPTSTPSAMPSSDPSKQPSVAPSKQPSKAPTNVPTISPTDAPVIPPTRAPTDECSRISVLVLGPNGEIPSTVDGIYYVQTYPWPASGYPYYKQMASGTEAQPGPTNFGLVYWEAGYWNIIDDNGIRLQYQFAFPLPTAYTPPHTTVTGNGWQNLDDGELWTVLIGCGAMTDPPSSHPTMEPTGIPSETPTTEPTHQPTMGQPTFVPTEEPSAASTDSQGENGGETAMSSFLDTFSVLEWLIIASLPLICLLICASLYIWRHNMIEAHHKEEQWHVPSAANDQDQIEFASPKRKSEPQKLGFQVQEKKKRVSALGKRASAHTPVNYKDEKVAADFTSALQVVSTHKSQRTLEVQKKQKLQEEYHAVGGRAPLEDASVDDVDPNTNDVQQMMTYDDDEDEQLNKQESEFYGNHPIDEIYSYTFTTKPFGMEWKTLKRDKKNLYVSKITAKSQAALGKIEVGSKLISFNGEMIEDLGAKKIYAKLAITDMPLTITFLKPFKKEQDKEGDSYQPTEKEERAHSDEAAAPAAGPPPIASAEPVVEDVSDQGVDSPLVPPNAPQVAPDYDMGGDADDPFADIGSNPMNVVPVDSVDVVDDDEAPEIKEQPTLAMMEQAQAMIPEVFDEDAANDDAVDKQETFHAD